MSPAAITSFIQIWQALAPLIGWLILIRGWHWIRTDNNSREDRKERRNALNDIIKDIKDLEKRAYEYYLKKYTDDAILPQVAIKRDQESIEIRIAHLKTTTGGFQSLEELTAFRRELTGGEFESKNRLELGANDQKFLALSLAINTLLRYLEGEYSRLYSQPVKRKKNN